MMKHKVASEYSEESHLIEMEDDSVLADGMIPDSRVIGLIDELDQSSDYFVDDDPEIMLKALRFQLDE